MRPAAGSRAGRTGASPAGWSRRRWRAAAPSTASPRRPRRAPASGNSCGAAGPSTRRRFDEARARHPRAPGSRRHAARAPRARRRGPAPRLGAPLRARRPASAGGGGGARRGARHLPAGAPALAGLAGAARAAGGGAPPGAPGARRRRPLRLHAVELPVLPARGAARARAAGGAHLLELRRRRGLPQAPPRPGAACGRALGRLAGARAPGDPFPLALLEGMALGRPIVASAVGGIPEMLEDGVSGCLVPPGDAPALAAAIAALLRDPAQRARVGAAARERLATRFSLEGFAAGMFAAFDDAVAAG